MKFYLIRHAQADDGPELQPDRDLTATGEAQLPVMARFLKTQTDKIGLVLCSSDMLRGQKTGEFLAKKLDVDVQYTPWVDPDAPTAQMWKTIQKVAATLNDDDELAVVSHGPTINSLAAWLLDSGEGDKFHFSHGSIAHFDTSSPAPGNGFPVEGRGKNVRAFLHWLVTPKLMNKAMEQDPDAVIEEALRIADEALGVRLDEKGRAYFYDVSNEKRFVPDATACDLCEDAGDEGWVEDDYVFAGAFGDEDGPPLHPNCGCALEYRERRYRVYESGERILESERIRSARPRESHLAR